MNSYTRSYVSNNLIFMQWRNKGVRRPGANQDFCAPVKTVASLKNFFAPFCVGFFEFFSLRPGPIPRLPPPLLRPCFYAQDNVLWFSLAKDNPEI